jgi:formamidopyrimidine-DNA glycosylase
MPELPEVETTRRDLAPRIVGQAITGVWVADPGPLRSVVPLDAAPAYRGPVPSAGAGRGPQAPLSGDELRAALVGRRIAGLERRGKYLILALSDGRFLILHRRMTGNLVLARPQDPPGRHLRAVIALDNGLELRWEDQRRLGTWTLCTDPTTVLRALGPEPLAPDWSAADLAAALRGRRAPVKAVLLDQRRVAGLGNIYADEALHRAGIHPARPAGTLRPDEVERLHAAVRAVLEKAIRLQGSSARHHVGGLGQKGTMQEEWRVYGRARLPCPACGSPVQKTRVAGRGTHFCPRCQPPDASPGCPAGEKEVAHV